MNQTLRGKHGFPLCFPLQPRPAKEALQVCFAIAVCMLLWSADVLFFGEVSFRVQSNSMILAKVSMHISPENAFQNHKFLKMHFLLLFLILAPYLRPVSSSVLCVSKVIIAFLRMQVTGRSSLCCLVACLPSSVLSFWAPLSLKG